MTSTVKYIGGLRTEATHLKSGKVFITDAPTDNNGKGEAFSPTDLIATALGSCMVTIMGIKSRTLGYDLEGIEIMITKTMASNPRRISRVEVELNIPHYPNHKERIILEKAGLACPVAKSLHPDLEQIVTFNWQKQD